MDVMFNDVQEVCRSSSLAISSSADICGGSLSSIVAVHSLSEAAWSNNSIQARSSVERPIGNLLAIILWRILFRMHRECRVHGGNGRRTVLHPTSESACDQVISPHRRLPNSTPQ